MQGLGAREYRSATKGESWKFRLMNTIDECMKYAADRDAFISLMESEGYQVRWEIGRKYITYTTPDGMRCRDNSPIRRIASVQGLWPNLYWKTNQAEKRGTGCLCLRHLPSVWQGTLLISHGRRGNIGQIDRRRDPANKDNV